LVDAFERLMMESIWIKCRPVDENELALGASKLGGSPDLPPHLQWPERTGGTLPFVAQINLAEAVPYDSQRILPKSGMLYFFFDVELRAGGGNLTNLRRNWQVLYFDGDLASLKQARVASDPPILEQEDLGELVEELNAEPLPHKTGLGRVFDKLVSFLRDLSTGLPETQHRSQQGYSPCAIEFGRWTIPQPDIFFYHIDGLAEGERERLWDLCEEIGLLDRNPQHQLLGHPTVVQDEEEGLQIRCQFESQGLDSHKIYAQEEPRAADLDQGTDDWRLLLQLESDDGTGMMWADAGVLSFWIQRQALEARDFENVWVILEST
jgi:uncharacterized protein YwqG